RVRHLGEPPVAREVEVAYVRDGRLQTVRARRLVLACWNSVIPLLAPELPAEQRQALASATTVPLVYTSVLLRDWKAWAQAGGRRQGGGEGGRSRPRAPGRLREGRPPEPPRGVGRPQGEPPPRRADRGPHDAGPGEARAALARAARGGAGRALRDTVRRVRAE